MNKHHIIISGTGRTGTSFLVRLFTDLGYDTGFGESNPSPNWNDNCNAGLEWDIRLPDAPYVVKSPWLCDYLDEVLGQGKTVIDHAIIPVRDLFSAAESRRDVARRSDAAQFPDGVPGGLWHTEDPGEQETILTRQFYKIMQALVKYQVSVIMLDFPRLVLQPEYLYDRLKPCLSAVSYESFLASFRRHARPELVHDFRKA